MKKSILLLAVLAVILSSCSQKPTGTIPVFDVTQKSYPGKTLILQDIATVEYIPLEVKENFLLGDYPDIHYMDEDMIVTGSSGYNSSGHIMFFDRKTGKALNSFSRKGRGPGEYISLGAIAVDRKAGEMFVLESSMSPDRKNPMHVYDLKGKHLRTLEIWMEGFQNFFHVYDENYLFFYDEADVTKSSQNTKPYRLVSRTDTTSTYLPLAYPNRDHMQLIRYANGSDSRVISSSNRFGFPVLKTAEGYIFSEPGIDTVYSWNRSNGELTPVVARTPTFGSMEYPVSLSVAGESSEYLFFEFEERRDYEPGQARTYSFDGLYYDKTDGQFYDGAIVNADYVDEEDVYQKYVSIYNISSSPVAYPPGVFVEVIQAVRLVDLHEKGKLRGPLAEVASKLKEDDNPVLMIATFK